VERLLQHGHIQYVGSTPTTSTGDNMKRVKSYKVSITGVWMDEVLKKPAMPYTSSWTRTWDNVIAEHPDIALEACIRDSENSGYKLDELVSYSVETNGGGWIVDEQERFLQVSRTRYYGVIATPEREGDVR